MPAEKEFLAREVEFLRQKVQSLELMVAAFGKGCSNSSCTSVFDLAYELYGCDIAAYRKLDAMLTACREAARSGNVLPDEVYGGIPDPLLRTESIKRCC